MPWDNSSAARRKSDATYKDPVYLKNKAIVRARSGGRCEWTEYGDRCWSRDRVQCDHTIPVTQGGTHDLANLRDLCKPHHDQKTAGEGGGYRARKRDPQPQLRTRW